MRTRSEPTPALLNRQRERAALDGLLGDLRAGRSRALVVRGEAGIGKSGGALAGIPTVLFALIARGPTAGIVTAVVFAVYTQIENHILNPVVMSKTVRINPLLIFIAVLVGASLGNLVGGLSGGFVAALLAIPTAGALQVLVKEIWQATAPDQESSAPAAPRPLAGQDLSP
jgi:hypothetical protein